MKVKPSVAIEITRQAIKHRKPVLMVGPPGCGKTDLNHLAAELEGFKLLELHPAIHEPTHFSGQPWVVDGKAVFLPYTEMRNLIEATVPTYAFFDDLGHAMVSVMAAVMQPLLARHVGEHKISDKVSFGAATNLRRHKAGVTSLIEPLKSRFVTIIELQQDWKEWCDWALHHNVPMEVIAAIRWKPSILLSEWQPAEDDSNSTSPRTIAHAGEIYSWGLSDEALYPAIVGAAGEGFATEFFAFLRFWRDLPDPDFVLAHPDTTPIPAVADGLGILHALTGALATRARRNTAQPLATIAERLPAEFGMRLMTDSAIRGGKPFTETKAYIEWEVTHAKFKV